MADARVPEKYAAQVTFAQDDGLPGSERVDVSLSYDGEEVDGFSFDRMATVAVVSALGDLAEGLRPWGDARDVADDMELVEAKAALSVALAEAAVLREWLDAERDRVNQLLSQQ